MKNKILITGAGGQLGMEWQNFLSRRGVDCRACNSSDFDITDAAQVAAIFESEKPDYVINCAAYTQVDKAEEEREKAMAVNATGPQLLAKACKTSGAKLIHYSTDYVFSGNEEDRNKYPRGYAEEHETNPQNQYGITKLEGERLIQEHCEDFLILRVSWLCGYYGNNFVKTMLRLGREKDSLKIINDQFGAPTFTRNVVENTVALLRDEQQGIRHISSAGLTNWYEFAEMIFMNSGIEVELLPIPTSEYPTAAKRPAYSKLDITKLKNTADSRIVNWNEGLEQLLIELKN